MTTTAVLEVFDPMRPEQLTDPYPAYAALRDRHPVVRVEPLGLWLVSRYADVRAVLAAPESFSAALAFGRDSVIRDARGSREIHTGFAGESGGVVSSTDGTVHTRLRRILARLLTRPRLDATGDEVRRHVGRVLAGLAADRDEFDVVTDLAGPVAGKAIGTVIGLDDATIRVLAAWVDTTFRSLDPGDPLSTPAARPRMLRTNVACFRAVTAFLSSAPPDNGLVEAWRAADTAGAREEVVLSVLQLFQAGFETIVSAVAHHVARFLVDRPLGDGGLDLIDEGLRLASPVRATMRTAVGDQPVGGVSIPDGERLLLLIGSANRDDRAFAEPDVARAGRVTPHLAFGSGPHRCLGRALAHLELRIVLAQLVAAVDGIASVPGAEPCANILKAGYHHLPVRVRWRPRPGG